MYLRDQVTLPQLTGWQRGGLGQPINAAAGANQLNAAQLAIAIRVNRPEDIRLGWKNLFIPISLYYLRFWNRVPDVSEFAQAIARWQDAVGGLGVDGQQN